MGLKDRISRFRSQAGLARQGTGKESINEKMLIILKYKPKRLTLQK